MNVVLDILDFISNNLNRSAKVKMIQSYVRILGWNLFIMLHKNLYYGGSLSFVPLVSAANII